MMDLGVRPLTAESTLTPPPGKDAQVGSLPPEGLLPELGHAGPLLLDFRPPEL